MLRIEGISAYYGNIAALQDVSVQVPQGKIVSIIGANGAGKSTLLKVISGLMPSRRGRITYLDDDISQLRAHRIVSLGISQVPEGRQLFAHLSVKDNIQLGAYHYFSRSNRQEILERMQSLYALFPILEKRAKQVAGTLSGGEQQMLAIARALMGRPRLLLLDEPSMGIAPLVVREIFDVIERLNQAGTTILLVEQNARAALNLAHYSYILERGEVVLEGLAAELSNDSKVKQVYLGG